MITFNIKKAFLDSRRCEYTVTQALPTESLMPCSRRQPYHYGNHTHSLGSRRRRSGRARCWQGLGGRYRRTASNIINWDWVLLVIRWSMTSIVCYGLIGQATARAELEFARDIRPLLKKHCFDCHADEEQPEGGINLERFATDADAMRNRDLWKAVFEKIESHQMPPPKETSQPTEVDRERVLTWITELAARPDSILGARDPGKPVLRRLTRLEYNNTVRDLLGLETDVFMFPERLPLANKNYFQPTTGKLGEQVEVRLREYGARYPVLLPQAGLPGDHRAEHGYRNRGDAMNFSPLLLEQYVALAGQIANHPELPRRSRVFADLLGIEYNPLPTATAITGATGTPGAGGSSVSPAVGIFAPNAAKVLRSEGGTTDLSVFRERLSDAFRKGIGGVFDVATSGNLTVPGKGGLMRVPFGDLGTKVLTINPNADLWLVSFSTAEETSGTLLIANKAKNEKRYELTFKIEEGLHDEGIEQLGLCVLGRNGQSGPVTITAKFSDGTESVASVDLREGAAGTTFVHFLAIPGEQIKTIVVDGTNFSGDYVLIDDLGFITSGNPVVNARPLAIIAAKPQTADAKPNELAPNKVAQSPVANTVSQLPARPASERLAVFVERAFRRPVDPSELAPFLSQYDAVLRSGKSESDAMRSSVHAILSSPGFLFVAQPSREGNKDGTGAKVRSLDDFELASRLSYFLWSSMPDDELLATARRGELRTDAGLASQTRRMLRDWRARELSESFAVQWLRLDQLYTSKPDSELYKPFYSGPLGKDTLHGAALVEALLLFETVLVEDRSIVDFIDAEYTWLNPRLARLYGIALESPLGDQTEAVQAPGQPNRELKKDAKGVNDLWSRVKLADRTRGGFLTMAGPLTITSLPFRTSPVKRGAWLLETVFNRPAQEPKVAFVVENDTKEVARQTSIRQRFEAHRNKPACYTCHIRLDPPGFAMERFDAIGGWREAEGDQPIDARGQWNDISFDGPAAFKATLANQPHEFTRGFIEHVLSYALGRQLGIYDMPCVAEIQSTAAADSHRLSRVILGVVNSYPFRHTRVQGPSQ